MAIHLGEKTKLTTDVERAFVEIGGADPDKTLSRQELSDALVHAIDKIADHRPSILRKIYNQAVKAGHLPPLDSE